VELRIIALVFNIFFMPWTCPLCRTSLRHSATEPRPRPNTLYSCPVCRVELELDVETEALVARSLADERMTWSSRTH